MGDALDDREKTIGGAIGHVITPSMHRRAQVIHILRRLGLEELPRGRPAELGKAPPGP